MSASVRANSAPSSARAERPREGAVAEVPCRTLVESSKTQLQPVHNEVIPEELLVSLTSTVCSEKRLMPSAHQRHCKGCTFRRPDAVWHHPLGRKKYQYFLEQPTSLGGAGRDISFLCDAAQRKAITLPPLSEKAADTQNMTVSESLIPDEYHIVKNKGLRSLELYEDAFTVQLQDDEQKLRVFPSMKPSGRQEVLQLMRVMDDMLEKAGVEQRSEELNELTQIEGLLELVRTEQNIYNVVFHELIRQVSVACAERGQLLAKLRQRYQSLLERIPQYLKALHTEAVAQRALDRQLTVEIHRIKTSIQQLSRELARIKAHDAFVSQQAERAQHELTEALNQSHNNSEVVQSYHELYELQRSRLNSQLMQMTEERDLWSHLTYCLALKVIRVKDLQLVSQLHNSEETWHQTAENCSVYINAKDSEDLKSLSDISGLWREELQRFMSELRRRDQAQCDVIRSVQDDISRWLHFCSSQQENHGQKCPRATMEEIIADFKKWCEALVPQAELFQGEEVLGLRESLEKMMTVRDQWLGLSLQLLQRHPGPHGARPQHYHSLSELQSLLSELDTKLSDHITGENGVHSQLQSLCASIEPGFIKLSELKEQPHGAPALDLKKTEKSLTLWKSLADKILQLILGEKIDQQTNEPALYAETKEAAHRVKVFVETLCSFINAENQTISREIFSVHKGRSRWMLDLLLLLVPDLEPHAKNHRERRLKLPHASQPSVPQLEEDAAALSQRVERLSKYFTRTCQLIYEEQSLNSRTRQEAAEKEVMECGKLENECTDWVDTSKILLVGLKMPPLETLTSLNDGAATREDVDSPGNQEVQEKHEKTDEHTEIKEETAEQELEQREPSVHNSPMVELISSDRSVVQNKLGERRVQLTVSEELVVAPVTEEAQRAFTDLNTVELLQQELIVSEEQVQSAQQRALKAEEALQVALQRIQDLERQVEGRSLERPETRDPKQPEPSTSPPAEVKAAPAKKTPPESKPQTSSKKTRKR